MKLDDFVAGVWLVCDDWHFTFLCDQWWALKVECQHHKFEVSCGIFKIENALAILYDRVVDWHEENK